MNEIAALRWLDSFLLTPGRLDSLIVAHPSASSWLVIHEYFTGRGESFIAAVVDLIAQVEKKNDDTSKGSTLSSAVQGVTVKVAS